jgi:hypothetical protein
MGVQKIQPAIIVTVDQAAKTLGTDSYLLLQAVVGIEIHFNILPASIIIVCPVI